MLSILTVLWAAVERIASLSSLLLTKGDPQFTTIFSFHESSKDNELVGFFYTGVPQSIISVKRFSFIL